VIGEPGKAPAPLVVVLHGDEGGPSRIVGAWATAARKAGAIVFGPKCPKDEGCAGSYWRWNGDPRWLFAEIDALAAKYAVDPRRRYIAGWSGGSTYLTYRTSEWFPEFAAASVAGGGAPEAGTACFRKAGGSCAPVHYLMGSGNPLFGLAVEARDRIRACGHDLEWNELPGADHQAEWSVYSRRTGEILQWLLGHENGCIPTASDAGAGPSVRAPPTGSPSAARRAPQSPDRGSPAGTSDASRGAPTAPPTRARCSCLVAGGASGASAANLGALLALLVILRGRRAAARPRVELNSMEGRHPARARRARAGRRRPSEARRARRTP
jgi:hypothetical protein